MTTLTTAKDFEDTLNDFGSACETFLKCFYENYGEELPDEKIIIDSLEEKTSSNLDEIQPRQNLEEIKEEIKEEKEKISFDDIAGQNEAVGEAKKLILEVKGSEILEKRGVVPIKGILFHGPSGTGKTLIAKAIASEIEAEFLSIAFSDISSKWLGDVEKNIQEVFNKANKITNSGKKVVILFDEMDSIAPVRNETNHNSINGMVSVILQNLDGFESNKNVFVIGTTNLIESIDPAVRRSGRLDKKILVDLPNVKGRKDILDLYVKKGTERATEPDILFSPELNTQQIAEITPKMNGADLKNLINLTLENKAIAEINGKEWTPVDFNDIKNTLEQFKMIENTKKLGF